MEKLSPVPVYILRANNGPITTVNFISNGDNSEEKLLTGFSDGSLCIWDMKTYRPCENWDAHSNYSVIWSKFTAGKLYSQGRTESMKEWLQTESGWVKNGEIKSSSPGFCNCDITTRDGQHIAAVPGSELTKLHIYDLQNKELIRSIDAPRNKKFGSMMCLQFGSKGDGNFFAGYENGSIVQFDLRTFRQISELDLNCDGIMCINYYPESKQGFAGGPGNKLKEWMVTEKGTLASGREVELTNAGLSVVNVRGDGKVLVTGGWDNRIRYFSRKTLKPLAVLDYHAEGISSLAFNSKGYLAAGSRDGRISLWNLFL